MDLLEKINKFGKIIKDNGFIYQCDNKDYGYLNVAFDPLKDISLYKKVEDLLSWKIPEDLMNLYQRYNGLMMFSESFRIYGLGIEKRYKINTIDIMQINSTALLFRKTNKFKNMVIFGTYGYYYLCYSRDDNRKVFVIGSRELEIMHIFNDLYQLFEYYIGKLCDEYDDKGYKIHIEEGKESSIFVNKTTEFI